MREAVGSVFASLRRWRDAAQTTPKLIVNVVRRGILPVGASAVSTLRKEGVSELHWKVLGDALVRFLSHSGPVLTKLGQILATRSDLLPEPVCARLERLYTGQPPMRKAKLERLLRRAYRGRSPFQEFDAKPIAVGSIGQVHRARLRDGERVIVKVIRPGVEKALRRDMNAVRVLVGLFFSWFARRDAATRAVVSRALDDLAAGLETEVDLDHEAAAVEDFRRRFADNPRVYVPICHREWSSKHILVLEELEGESLAEVRRRAGSDPETARAVADMALREILTQIFDEGRFHADPHGGNLLLLPDGRLGLVDLGLTGELRPAERRSITRAVRAFLARDPDATIRALLEFGAAPPDFDLDAFKADVRDVLLDHKGGVMAQVTGKGPKRSGDAGRLEEFVNGLFAVAHRHRIYVPPSATLLIKTLVTIEGVARSLDPKINIVVTAVPIVLRSLTPKWLRWSYWTRTR